MVNLCNAKDQGIGRDSLFCGKDLPILRQQILLARDSRRLDASRCAKLGKHRRHVMIDGLRRYVQSRTNLPVTEADGQTGEDLHLAYCQAESIAPCGRTRAARDATHAI